jgi:hypothetical protein
LEHADRVVQIPGLQLDKLQASHRALASARALCFLGGWGRPSGDFVLAWVPSPTGLYWYHSRLPGTAVPGFPVSPLRGLRVANQGNLGSNSGTRSALRGRNAACGLRFLRENGFKLRIPRLDRVCLPAGIQGGTERNPGSNKWDGRCRASLGWDGRMRPSLRVSYCNFSYSALACFRTGRSGSASFQAAKKSW